MHNNNKEKRSSLPEKNTLTKKGPVGVEAKIAKKAQV